jgi:hypothetical protein
VASEARMRSMALASRVVLSVVICAAVSVSLAAQGGVGAISGTIVDASGGVMPGVAVTLTSPGLIGGHQETVTDERGVYQFTRLVPATYAVRVELTGFSAGLRENIIVNADVTARVDLTLTPGELSETVMVSGGTPLLDTASVLNQTVLSREVLDTLPQGRDLWSIARLVPGVLTQRYDVGGSNALLLSHASVHGSLTSESGYLIDNVDVSWAGGDGGSQANGWDSNMYQEINYQLGNASAEYQKGGVVYNMVTKTGTNAFHGSFSFTGTNDRLQSGNITSELLADLRAGVPARALQANPELNPAAKVLDFVDSSASLSGPVLRDRLWFSATAQGQLLNRYAIGTYNPDGTQFVEDFGGRNLSIKLSWQATTNSQLHYTHIYNFQGRYHLSFIREFMEARATYLFKMPSDIDQVRWTATLSPRLVLDVGGAYMRNMWPQGPQDEVRPGDIPRFDAVTRVHTVAQGTYDRNPNYTGSANASLSYAAGGHDLRAGYQFSRRMDKKEAVSMSHHPAGLRAIYRNGVPDSVDTYNTPTTVQNYLQDHGLFVQDTWRPIPKLTLNLGLRVQKTNGWVPASCQAETLFIAAQCFPEVADVPSWLDVAPRTGVVYDLFGNGRTALKFAANRYNLGVGAAHVNRVNPIRVASSSRQWSDRNGDQLPQLDELGPATGFNLGTTNRYNPDLKRPYVNEFSVEVEHQLQGDLVVGAGYFHRNIRRNIGSRNVAVPADSYIPLTVTERSSGRTLTVYNQDPALRGRFDTLWDNFDELDGTFKGVDLTFNKRLANRWMLMGGVSFGRNTGDTYAGAAAAADLNNPNNTFRNGLDQRDVPVSFKLSGIYELPYGVTLGASVQHFTGFPEPVSVSVGSDTVALTQVTQSVRVEEMGATRLPDNDIVDLNLRKTFAVRGVSIAPVIEVFNLTNANTTQSRLTQLGPAYQRVTSIQFPRMLRLGASVKF